MTPTTKPVTRRTETQHSRHRRRIVVTVHGDSIGLRLDREPTFKYLSIEKLYDQADLKAACAATGFDASPCKNPRKGRGV